MFEYIDKVRKKDEKSKKRIAFYFALGCAVVVFIIWLTVSLPQIENSKKEKDAARAESKSPVTNFIDLVSGGIMQVQKNISEAKEAINVLGSTTIYYQSTTSIQSASTTNIEKVNE